MNRFPKGVAKHPGHYVYRLIDPRDGQTFYVGKGQGDRIFAHVNGTLNPTDDEDVLSIRQDVIAEIITAGLHPIHVIHRHGMTENVAFEVEAALIDCFSGLTNVSAGQGSRAGQLATDCRTRRRQGDGT